MGDNDNIDIEQVSETARKGFDLKARLKGRALRKGSVTLYLDEEVGAELGWVRKTVETDLLGREAERVDRRGVLGELDLLEQVPEAERDSGWGGRHAELSAERDRLVGLLEESGITVHLQAVPPVIYKDVRRRARDSAGITEKGIPDDKRDAFVHAFSAHLMSVMVTRVVENATRAANDGLSYSDAEDLLDLLPPGQMARLDERINEIQLVDQISEQIETQEDFS